MINLGLEAVSISIETLCSFKNKEDFSVNKAENMATDEQIKEAETNLGFKFGKQTKELFKSFSGLYYGTVEFADLKRAVSITQAHFHDDDRLQGKSIDKLFIGSYGNGDWLVVDSSDKVYEYTHDGNPAFNNASKLTKSNDLKKYIKQDYEEYLEYKNSKKKVAQENLSVIVGYLEAHPENRSAVVDFLKQDPSFEQLLSGKSNNELINKLQNVVSTESSRISSDFVVGSISVSIAGKQHRLKISVAGSSWPTVQFNGFNKFIEKSESALKAGLESHRKDLHDYLDFECCKRDKLPEPSFDNFKKMIKLDHLIISSKGCAICGEMPWDREHGIGILLDPSGSISGLTDYHSAYDKLV